MAAWSERSSWGSAAPATRCYNGGPKRGWISNTMGLQSIGKIGKNDDLTIFNQETWEFNGIVADL